MSEHLQLHTRDTSIPLQNSVTQFHHTPCRIKKHETINCFSIALWSSRSRLLKIHSFDLRLLSTRNFEELREARALGEDSEIPLIFHPPNPFKIHTVTSLKFMFYHVQFELLSMKVIPIQSINWARDDPLSDFILHSINILPPVSWWDSKSKLHYIIRYKPKEIFRKINLAIKLFNQNFSSARFDLMALSTAAAWITDEGSKIFAK